MTTTSFALFPKINEHNYTKQKRARTYLIKICLHKLKTSNIKNMVYKLALYIIADYVKCIARGNPYLIMGENPCI